MEGFVESRREFLRITGLSAGAVLFSPKKAGLDLKTVMEVVKVADFRSPLLVNNVGNILERDFSTSFALQLMLKDANLIQQFGETFSSPIPALRVVQKILQKRLRLALEKKTPLRSSKRWKKGLVSKSKQSITLRRIFVSTHESSKARRFK